MKKKIFCAVLVLALAFQLAVPASAREIPGSGIGSQSSLRDTSGSGIRDAEPVEPVDPADPTEPTDPTDPIDPTDPTEPELPEPRPDETHKPYIAGQNDGGFHPRSKLTRAELAVILFSQITLEPGEPHFPDVREGAWYAEAVNAMAAAGYLAGYADGTFRPRRAVTRAECAAILAKICGETASAPATFPDVKTHWARNAIALAQEKGWVTGYADGTFRPNNSITRAEAVVMINHFLGRVPDQEAVAAGEGLRFFPDVRPGSWYYAAVMEAATDHTAHYETPESDERWQDPAPGAYNVHAGFYYFSPSLYAAEGGAFVQTAGEGTLNGVSYTCAGESGVCTARTEVLALANGSLVLLRGGTPIAAPGRYQDGFSVRAGLLYVVRDGWVVNIAGSGELNGVPYVCTGKSGVCTTADWTVLDLPGVDLSVFESELTPEAEMPSEYDPTLADVIRAAVRIYEAYFRVEYPTDEVPEPDWIGKALEYGILDEAPEEPDAPVSRGEACVLLCRALRGRELEAINYIPSLPDLDSESAWASSVLCLCCAGVLEGEGDERLIRPDAPLTAAELAEVLCRLERREERVSWSVRVVELLQYGTSGSGRYPLTAYRLGSGENVMVLTFAIHGWEDNWDRDGEELVYLADQTKAWLEEHYELVEEGGWTVYILRCLNPDGLYLGSSSNGPGRCTTTYFNENGELVSGRGIDMNRCFPYRYQQMTDARNFNGTEPLQCVEARALYEFVQGIKGEGWNICVDTHGWYGQIITTAGKGTLYNAFQAQFPASTYTYLSRGYGYFTGWTGFVMGFDSCLLELPRGINGHSAFLNAGCVEKYENAIQTLLQHYDGPNASRNAADYVGDELDGN